MKYKKSYSEQLLELVQEYRADGQPWPTETEQVADWALDRGKWSPRLRDVRKVLARDLARALRDEMYTDPQGRRARKKHSVRTLEKLPDGRHRQHHFWVDIEDAECEQVHTAFRQRREQILADCQQLKTDVDSYNENNRHGDVLQLSFDFTEDLADLDQPTTYEGLTV